MKNSASDRNGRIDRRAARIDVRILLIGFSLRNRARTVEASSSRRVELLFLPRNERGVAHLTEKLVAIATRWIIARCSRFQRRSPRRVGASTRLWRKNRLGRWNSIAGLFRPSPSPFDRRFHRESSEENRRDSPGDRLHVIEERSNTRADQLYRTVFIQIQFTIIEIGIKT